VPEYTIGGHAFRRKHGYMPCALAGRTDEMSDEEYAKLQRRLYWSDFISEAQWERLLGKRTDAPTRSKLKRKAIGWLMALNRIAVLDRELAIEIMDRAGKLYEEQVTEPGGGSAMINWNVLAEEARGLWLPSDGNEHEEED
jgi:hypothetical protein